MMTRRFALLAPFLTVFSLSAWSSESQRPDHYEGLPAETLEIAVRNFSEYNGKLEAIISKGTLTVEDMEAVHQLTYTLENALGKINEELSALAETLEDVHVASENQDQNRVKARGQEYLSVSRKVID
ncbi:MAG: DUF6746 family protein [Gammaproteobacteria bacterium]